MNMAQSKPVPEPARSWSACWMLCVFAAYLAVLPFHALKGGHCLPGVVPASAHDHHAAAAAPAGDALHAHHQHSDGSRHHHHHTSDDDEVKFAGKIGSFKHFVALLKDSGVERHSRVDERSVVWTASAPLPIGFQPGHWLIVRGPPLA